ncbi:hypothetical protein WN48_05747 [Eufriesea mexicana]|uniref:Uncharacterized protein n=1 Tax=Eufriesea mexicana TaxID=516756 RepID=A0A310SMJ6_9HYME|nr:hypothetical protein WN48_05747 [Eufriesea mexicana]
MTVVNGNFENLSYIRLYIPKGVQENWLEINLNLTNQFRASIIRFKLIAGGRKFLVR